MKTNNSNFGNYVILLNEDFLNKQRVAGKCVQECLKKSEDLIKSSANLTTKNIEKECLQIIKQHNCIPTFLNYKTKNNSKPFPGAICASVNEELVHGIPNNKLLQSGDIVKIDLGATYQGAIADAARIFIFGGVKNPKHAEMIDLCRQSLKEAISKIKIGSRHGMIGKSIYDLVKKTEFQVITDYGGHHITWNKPHAFPFIENKSNINEGIRFQAGMSFAIEPLIKMGNNNQTRIAEDGWTVLCDDMSAHFEDTLFVTDKEIINITAYENSI